MLELKRFMAVPAEVVAACGPLDSEAAHADAHVMSAAIEVPGHEGAFRCAVALVPASDTAAGDVALVVALDEERSDLGAGLVEGLWFERPATLWLPAADRIWRLEVAVWRCHIAGPTFACVLSTLRRDNPMADVASVWELRVTGCALAGEMPPARTPSRAPRAEVHLDTLARGAALYRNEEAGSVAPSM